MYKNKSLLLFFMLFLFTSCSKREERVPKSLEETLHSHGVQQIQIDLDYQSPDHSDKKYLSLTATYNFASADGKPQREFQGYILNFDGHDWIVEKKTTYTKNEQKAKDLLAGAPK